MITATFTPSAKPFAPFQLTIDVNTKAELQYLWHVFNVADQKHFKNEETMPFPLPQDTHEVWKVLNERAEAFGIVED